MLQAKPKGWFSYDYRIVENDNFLADINQSWWREAGDLTINGTPYRVYRDGMSGPFVLEQNGAIIVQAVKSSMWNRRFDLDINDASYVLEGKNAFSREFVLRQKDRQIGTIAPPSMWSRAAQIDLPNELPLAVQVFLTWLVLIMWRRSDSAATSA